MDIKGFQELTLKDWPGKVASIIFTGGCNLHCFYCYNAELAFCPEKIETIEKKVILKKLENNKDWIDGIIISGGEPTIHGDKLKSLISELKRMGFKIKLFTNGTNPVILKELIQLSLIDAVSIDIKHAPGKYYKVINSKNNEIEQRVLNSIEIAKESCLEVYFRTTIIKGIHCKEDIETIKKIIFPHYLHLQNVQDKGVLEEYRFQVQPFTVEEFESFKSS